MPKSFEGDYPAPHTQPELPAELLPTPADDSLPERMPAAADDEHLRIAIQEIEQDERIPESIRPAVAKQLTETDRDFDRVDTQAQTTSGLGTRERAGISDRDDEEAHAIRVAKKLLATTQPPKRKRTRQGLGARGRLIADGPPAHVAEDVRRAQGLIE